MTIFCRANLGFRAKSDVHEQLILFVFVFVFCFFLSELNLMRHTAFVVFYTQFTHEIIQLIQTDFIVKYNLVWFIWNISNVMLIGLVAQTLEDIVRDYILFCFVHWQLSYNIIQHCWMSARERERATKIILKYYNKWSFRVK